MGEWMPIESAPRDRDQQILLLLHSGRVVTGRAYYTDIVGPQKPGGGRETVGEKFSGYVEVERDSLMPCKPSHWMPLPEPPHDHDD